MDVEKKIDELQKLVSKYAQNYYNCVDKNLHIFTGNRN